MRHEYRALWRPRWDLQTKSRYRPVFATILPFRIAEGEMDAENARMYIPDWIGDADRTAWNHVGLLSGISKWINQSVMFTIHD